MKPRPLLFAAAAFALSASAQELPQKEKDAKLEFEPDVLLQDLPAATGPLSGAARAASLTTDTDVPRAEAAVERYKRKAARWLQLYHDGVLSRVEAEGAASQVVQATLRLAHVRANFQRQELETARQKLAAGELTAADVAAAEKLADEAAAAATQAHEDLKRAKSDAAESNLARQRQLFDKGLITKSQLKRAEAAQQEAR